MDLRLARTVFLRDFTNLSLVERRHVDGYIVSMHQSGSHWLKYMLVNVICREYGVPLPEFISDLSVVGSPKAPPDNPGVPRLVASHTIPSALAANGLLNRLVQLPPRVLLVRDIRSMLVSHYEKKKDAYGVSFSEFLRGDPAGRRFDKDIWWDIRFLGAWGRMLEAQPERTHLVRYEALREAPVEKLAEICRFLGLKVSGTDTLETAVAASSKDRMQAQENPDQLYVVSKEERNPFDWFSEQDRVFFTDTCRRNLKHWFGYDYAAWGR